jgi:hypothetical protein
MGAAAVIALVLALAAVAAAASDGNAQTGGQSNGSRLLQATYRGSTTPTATAPAGAFGIEPFELFPMAEVEGDLAGGGGSDRRHSHGQAPFTAPTIAGASVVTSPAGFAGLNHFEQRFIASGGTQFSLEPPDQGLCVGNGFVLETINTVLRVYSTSGTPLSPPIGLNEFYGYAPAIIRTPPVRRGPFITDPSCWYDQDTQRWYHVALTLDVVPSTGAFTGANHIDIAVSKTSNPLGAWNLYSINVANDRSDVSTANHPQCPCLGDYPQIGVDGYGFYIATNEGSFSTDRFNGAQLYAMSKRALAAGVTSPTVVHFDKLVLSGSGTPGFTVWPARSLPGQHATEAGGTEYFLSSIAALTKINAASEIGIWALTNTSSLDSPNPDLALTNRALDSQPYGEPPPSNQKPGPTPLRDCINDRTTVFATTQSGAPVFCAEFLGGTFHGPEVEGPLDSNDTRMQQVWYSNGLLFGALDTAANVGGAVKAGIAWFVVRPAIVATATGKVVERSVDATIVNQGYFGVANNNVIWPAIAVRPDGKGVMAFTLVGGDYHPSAAWASISAAGVGNAVHVSGAGAGPQDGFTEYKAFATDPDNPRPRWGDYSAAAIDGNTVWIGSEYINQSCTYEQYVATNFRCANTRTSLANWATHITPVTP